MRSTLLIPYVVALALGAGLARAEDDAPPGPHRQVEKGAVKLREGFDDALELKLGRSLKATTKIHVTEWFDAKAISGQVDVENPTDVKMHFGYHIAFFDAEGVLVGCASQTMEVEPKDSTIVGGALMPLPADRIGKVATYQIVWYEDEQEIGKR